MKRIGILFILAIMLGVLVNCERERVTEVAGKENQTDFKENDNPLGPEISFQIGVAARLWKPKHDCLKGLGICEITALLINIDFARRVFPAQFSATNDSLFLEFEKSVDIVNRLGQNYMDIDAGDEFISLSPEVVDTFNARGIDLANIKLVQGRYYFRNTEYGHKIVLAYEK